MSFVADIEIAITLLPTASGGRNTALNLSGRGGPDYRPLFRVKGASEVFGVAFISGPSDPVPPGVTATAIVRCPYFPSAPELVQGAEFEILEGTRVVGHGRVVLRR